MESLPRGLSIVAGIVLVVVIGYLDYLTGYDLSFSSFYLLPLFLLAWKGGPGGAWLGVLTATAARTLADLLGGHPYSSVLLPIWNTGMRVLLYGAVAYVLLSFHRHVERERTLARTDTLTGTANTRAFLESAKAEVERSRRYGHSVSLAYLDLDNFKAVNDSLGHAAGDEMLRNVAGVIRGSVRSTDLVARLGGDEFAILFPEADEGAVRAAVGKLQLRFDTEARKHDWPIGLSVGVETAPPGSAIKLDAMIVRADARMYEAKQRKITRP